MAELDIITEAKEVIGEYALKEELTHHKRMEICKCASCKQDWKDATDRLDWIFGVGKRWGKKPKITIDKGPDGHISVDDLPWDNREPA